MVVVTESGRRNVPKAELVQRLRHREAVVN
jgi:hypothetical protein